MLKKLGKYEIRRELGRGAMGIVYEGFDPFIERTVAIKTIQKSLIDQSEAAEIFGRFRREAQAAGRLSHPNIVAIYEYGEEGDMAFIAMELLAGVELKEHFDNAKKFQISEAANIMYQLLEALEYSHGRGVVHRDIKPSNILITPGDRIQGDRIKIADFGIAKIESSDLTQAGTVLGTPVYMSPEQFMGQNVDGRSDLYSAGVLLYQLLTGERPFSGSNLTMIMQKVMHQAPVLPGELKIPGVSKALDEVVKKALAKRPQDRFQTAAEFLKSLRLALAPPQPVGGSADAERTLKLEAAAATQGGNQLSAAVAFNLADFENRLAQSRREISSEISQSVIYKEPEVEEPTLKIAAAVAPVQKVAEVPAPALSGLLASLALEAKQNLDSRQSSDEDKQARARRVHDALEHVLKFFIPFARHVNAVEPAIKRIYRLDARAVFSNLKWQGATVDYRKQSMAEEAHWAYVAFSVNLVAPEPLLLKRPWGQFDALKRELQHLRLRVLDDLDEIHKRPTQEWLEARLDPALPLQISFQGNYETDKIDVVTRNLEDFGQISFTLEPAAITQPLLDELGLFLIGRSEKLPAILRGSGK